MYICNIYARQFGRRGRSFPSLRISIYIYIYVCICIPSFFKVHGTTVTIIRQHRQDQGEGRKEGRKEGRTDVRKERMKEGRKEAC